VPEIAIRSSAPPPVLGLLDPTRIVRDLWRHRGLLRQFTRREIQKQYRATALGLAWAGVQPVLLFLVYAFVFTQIFPSRWENAGARSETANVALMFFTGFVVFRFFSSVVDGASNTVVNKRNLVQRVVFPLEILPAAALGKHLLFLGVGAALILAGSLAFKGGVSPTAPLALLVLIPLAMLSLAASYFLAALGVFLRDLPQGVRVFTRMLLFLSPVFYPLERVPERYRPLIELNPLTTVILDARRTALLDRPPDWTRLAALTLIALVAMVLAYAFFVKSKRGFADVL